MFLRLALVPALALALFAPATATADPLGDQFRVSNQGTDGDTAFEVRSPDIAYNSQTNQYLSVWIGSEEGGDEEVFGRLIDATGGVVGDAFVISGDDHAGSEQFFEPPSVTYNVEDNEFLVSWNTENPGEIFVQRISATGAQVGPDDLLISDAAYGDIETTDLRYSPEADVYFVTWKATLSGPGQEIFGQILARDGSEVGDDIQISDAGSDDATALAYNSQSQEFLVVWQNDVFVFGQRINTAGEEVGANDFQISDAATDPNPPRVEYNVQRNEYLVAWYGSRDNDDGIYAQRLAADGTQIGADDFRISKPGPQGANRPDIAYNLATDEYVVVWHSYGDLDGDGAGGREAEVFGQRLAGDGTEIGTDDFRISVMGPDGDTTFEGVRPTVAYSQATCNYTAVWFGNTGEGDMADNELEIWGRRLSASGCPDLSITKSGSPAEARVGDTVTYTLTATSSGGLSTGVSIADTLPTGMTFLSASNSAGACEASGQTVSCPVGNLASGATATVTIQARADASGTMVNTATVGGGQVESDTANNTASATTTVAADAVAPEAPPTEPTAAQLRVRLRNMPSSCVRRGFTARVRVTSNRSVTSIRVFIDGKRVRSTRDRRFGVKVRAGSMSAGRHSIRVVARNAAGQKRTARGSFTRCAAATRPTFTG